MTWPAAEFGDAWAPIYDDAHPELAADTPAAVAFVRGQTPVGGRVVDLGTGTGRLAIPLAATGIQVVGIDASRRMLQVLGTKPGAAGVVRIVADMRALPLAGPVDLVLCTFNTFFALPDADSQTHCLAEAARVAPRGQVVIDAVVPEPWRLDPRHHDPVAQVFTTTHHVDGIGPLPLKGRYAHPAQIDRMARSAGLRLHARLSDWAGTPWADSDRRHISIYRPHSTSDAQGPSPQSGAA